jgi:hypothetical protein
LHRLLQPCLSVWIGKPEFLKAKRKAPRGLRAFDYTQDYPREFSHAARARIEAERIKGVREFEELRSMKNPDGWTFRKWDQVAFYVYIMRAFLAFGREACRLAASGTWAVDQARSESEEFLRTFTIDAYYENGRDRSGSPFPKMTTARLRSGVSSKRNS